MKHSRSLGGDLGIEGIDSISFDGDLRAVFRGVFPAFHDVGFGSISLDNSQRLILVKHLETEATYEEVQTFA